MPDAHASTPPDVPARPHFTPSVPPRPVSAALAHLLMVRWNDAVAQSSADLDWRDPPSEPEVAAHAALHPLPRPFASEAAWLVLDEGRPTVVWLAPGEAARLAQPLLARSGGATLWCPLGDDGPVPWAASRRGGTWRPGHPPLEAVLAHAAAHPVRPGVGIWQRWAPSGITPDVVEVYVEGGRPLWRHFGGGHGRAFDEHVAADEWRPMRTNGDAAAWPAHPSAASRFASFCEGWRAGARCEAVPPGAGCDWQDGYAQAREATRVRFDGARVRLGLAPAVRLFPAGAAGGGGASS